MSRLTFRYDKNYSETYLHIVSYVLSINLVMVSYIFAISETPVAVLYMQANILIL